MPDWFGWWRRRRDGPDIPQALWQAVWRRRAFLAVHADHPVLESRLRRLTAAFLARKQFEGAQGLQVTDDMALDIAVQAVLPLLHRAADAHVGPALAWYDDFVGIVVHPMAAVARRRLQDEAGVVHEFDEELAGEAMERGPVMLSWDDVSADSAAAPTNVVIHEFIHKIDMCDGAVDACPPLPPGFGGTGSAGAARRAWFAVLEPAYDAFREQVIRAERFGGEPTWLDPYGATAIEEFFPVACEAYFTHRDRFGDDWPSLLALFDAFFRPGGAGAGPRR